MVEWLQQLEFGHPARLYALLLVPLVLYFGVASANGLSLWRRVASSGARTSPWSGKTARAFTPACWPRKCWARSRSPSFRP